MKKIRYIIIGLLAIAAIALLVWGLNYLKGNNFFAEESNYVAIYNKVDGLVESSPVLIKGLNVGKVKEIRFVPDTLNNFKVFVSFSVDPSVKIPDSTIAKIESIDLMGSKAINLLLGTPGKYHTIGDTLLSRVESDLAEQVSREMLPLKRKAEDLMLSIDSVMVVIQYIFNEKSRDNISKSLASIQKTINTLERTTLNLEDLIESEKEKLGNIFSNIESITSNFRNNNNKLSNILANFEAISDSLAKADMLGTINYAKSTLSEANTIMAKINNGEGTIGMLINNDTLYHNLEEASLDLDMLIKDIEANPKKYLHFSIFDFGKTYVLDEEGNVVKKRRRRDKKKEQSEDLSDNQVYFKVQIRSSKNKIEAKSKEFKGFGNIKELYYNGWYKYTIGSTNDFSEIKLIQNNIRQTFPDAFVIAVKNGKQIEVKDALKEI